MESPNKRQSLVRRGEYEADVPTGASKAVPLVLSVGCAVSDQGDYDYVMMAHIWFSAYSLRRSS
jgi:hypothetical protein